MKNYRFMFIEKAETGQHERAMRIHFLFFKIKISFDSISFLPSHRPLLMNLSKIFFLARCLKTPVVSLMSSLFVVQATASANSHTQRERVSVKTITSTSQNWVCWCFTIVSYTLTNMNEYCVTPPSRETRHARTVAWYVYIEFSQRISTRKLDENWRETRESERESERRKSWKAETAL